MIRIVYKILFTLLIFSSFSGLSQQKESDSVLFEQTLALIKRSTYLDSTNVFAAIKKIEPLIQSNARRKALLWNRLGDFYFYSGNSNKATEYYNNSQKIALSIKDNSIYYSSEIKKAILSQQVNSKAAEEKLVTILDEINQSSDYENIILCNNTLGFIYEDKSNFEKSIYYFLNALKAAEKKGDPYLIAMVLNNIGLSKINHQQYESGLKDLKRGLQYADKFNNPILEFYLLNNIGIIYNEQKNYRKSIDYYTLTLKKAISMGYSNQIAASYYNLSKSYLLYNKTDVALQLADSSIHYLSKDPDKKKVAKSLLLKSTAYFQKKNYNQALIEVNNVLRILNDIDLTNDESEAYRIKSEIYNAKGDYKSSLVFYKLYSSIKDSIAEKASLEQIAKLQLNFDIEQKEVELQKEKALNAMLEKDKTVLKAESQLRETRNIFIILFGIFSVVFISVFVYIRQERLKKKQKAAYAQQLIESIDSERLRISRDLHDDVGQYLSILKSKVNAIKKGNHLYLADVEEDLGVVVDKMRSISHELHPSHLEKIGLQRSIIALLNDVGNSTGLIISHSLGNVEDALTLEEKNHLYRILQECINNTLKHTNAKAIKVSLHKEDKQIVFEYKDNGTVSNDNSRLNKTKGIGLQTIEERTEKIKGKLVYELDAQKGFYLQIKK